MGSGLSDAFRAVDTPTHTVDVFGDVAILSTYAEVDVGAIARQLPQTTVYLKRRPRTAQRAEASEVAPVVPLKGPRVVRLEAQENGLKFEIRPENGLSVGLYLDAAVARAWVQQNARGKTVLNLFAYTCGFSVAARAGGAARVLNIDRSRRVLDWGEQNHALNRLPTDRRDFLAGDAFEWVPRLVKKGERFDLVVLDPPSFATAAKSRFSAQRDYAALVRAVAPLVGERLLACCNLESASDAVFRGWVAQSLQVEQSLRVPAPLKAVVAKR